MASPQLSCSLSSPPRRAGSTEPSGEHAREELSSSSSSPTESKVPVEEPIVHEALVQVPTENKVLKTTDNESKVQVEEPIMSKALVEVPTDSKFLKTAELEEIWGWSSRALPQLNRLPSSPPGRAESTKPIL